MGRLLVSVLGVSGVLAIALAGPASSVAATKSCKDNDPSLSQLKAAGVGCKVASQVMLGWVDRCVLPGPEPLHTRTRDCSVFGYQLVAKKAKGGVRVRGTHGNKVVRFFDAEG